MLYLSKEKILTLGLTSTQIIDKLGQLMSEQGQGNVFSAPKAAISTEDQRYMMATISATNNPPYMAVKALVVNQKNAEQGLDTINGTITLLNSQTGLPLAVMDGNWITGIRTAAASALAARRMANPDSSVLAFVGCGVQAVSHLDLFSEMFPLTEVRLLGRGLKNRQALMAKAESMGLKAVDCDSAEAVVEGADLVVSSIPLTIEVEPFIDANWLKEGAFVSSVDLAMPWKPESMSTFDRIVVDDLQQEAAMPKPLVEPSLVMGDLNGLLKDEFKGREAVKERTAFVFRAVPLGDLALASLVYEAAIERGVSGGKSS
ncbi:ornithine cyclodeaminase family protein [Leucothrix pacifica]|uniref:Ornithine cyclodeaminase n=1 Tax=Leucothrix pacifica TaxID=1247513 RepID=A0A317C8H8_9GAMM|nr:ornithine cyclodeaminase family protein [Leucothrix pacifica]PWQ92620.1 ornithine cyclodeaminase [Leucothrix pacifica]